MTASRTSEGVRWGEVGVGFATVTFAAIAGWQAGQIPGEGVGSSVGPNVIPWVVSGMLGLFGAALVVEALRQRTPPPEDGDHAAIDSRGAFWMLLGLLLNITLIEYAGFILSSTLLFLCTARAFGSDQPARDAAIGFALAFVSYIGFDRLLGYKIGSGLIERLF